MHDLFDDASEYGDNLHGAWEVVPRLLDSLDRAEIHATWSTVGFLFARDPAELAAHRPAVVLAYDNGRGPQRTDVPPVVASA